VDCSFVKDDDPKLEIGQEETTRNYFGFSGFRDLMWRNESRTGLWRVHKPLFHRKRCNFVPVGE
jgi:hypothetical protein